VLPTVGDPLLGADVDTGATGDAHPFAPVGDPCSSAATARKSAGTGQRLSSQAQNPSSGHSQNEQKAENEQKEHLWLRLFDGSFSFRLVFLGSEPSLIWLS
jgi:hypothetical protein